MRAHGILVGLWLAGGCGPEAIEDHDGRTMISRDLVFRGVGFEDHAGERLHYALARGGGFVDLGWDEVPAGGVVGGTFVEALRTVDDDAVFWWWLDVDGDDRCEGPADDGDLAWSAHRDHAPVTTWRVDHDLGADDPAPDADACRQPWPEP